MGAVTSTKSVPACTSAICAGVMKSKTDTDSRSLLATVRVVAPVLPSE